MHPYKINYCIMEVTKSIIDTDILLHSCSKSTP